MRKTFFGLSLIAMLLALSFPAEAQQPAKIPRIANLIGAPPAAAAARIEAFRQVCASLDTWRGRTVSVSCDLLRENLIASPRSRPN